jgi:LEA14-like dessication related protein
MYRNSRREGHDSIGTTTPAHDYYLAEGATGYDVGYITYVLIQNPNTTPTNVNLTYMTGSGQVAGPSFTMPANSRHTVRVNDQLPTGTDVSTHVHGSAPIIAERAMYWGAGTPLGEACHDSVGMASPHRTFYLPDGQSSNGYETWTLVQNPNPTDVTVQVTYMTSTGKGNVTKTETLKGNSRKTFNMAEHSGISGRASIMVTSKTPGKKIMVERAMYWNNRGAGTDTIGGYSD